MNEDITSLIHEAGGSGGSKPLPCPSDEHDLTIHGRSTKAQLMKARISDSGTLEFNAAHTSFLASTNSES
jgi:hypothetical protein